MTPIIVFSGFSDVFSEAEAQKTGIPACVSKAESLSVLLHKARAAASHPRALQSSY